MALGVPLAGGQYSLQSALIFKTPQHFHLLVIFQPARSRFKGLKLWLHFIFLYCLLLKACGLCLTQR